MSTAKITQRSAQILENLQRNYHKSKTMLIEQALTRYESQLILDEINQGYSQLKADPMLWAQEIEERNELEGTLADGLSDE